LPFGCQDRSVLRDDRPPFVLVAGAWLGGWAWRDVVRRLRTAGHEVHPTTLTGLGDRVHLARPEIDLEVHVADVVSVLDAEELEHTVLVGHSYAGIVITGVADRRPDRLGAVVWLDSSPVPDGTAITDVLSPEQRERQDRDVRERGDGWRWPVVDRETLASGMFGSVAGLGEERLRMIVERATPQPYATFTSPLHLRGSEPTGHRRAMIVCTAGGMTAATLRELIARGDPRAAVLAAPDWELYELATGHWPMFSSPIELADLLHRIAATRPVT
jgi:pimeloyl-ACP methyl ester carboxylesterase